jgi:hypothetical protein
MKLHGSKTSCILAVCWCASLNACTGLIGDDDHNQQPGSVTSGTGGDLGLGGATGSAGNSATAGATSFIVGTGDGGASAGNACSVDGVYRCTETAIEVCVNQTWQRVAECSPDLCDAAGGRCMSCVPGSHRCAGFNLQTCASTGDSWVTTAACDTSAYCDSDSNICRVCLAGEAFCGESSLYKCNPSQNGWDVVDCAGPDPCNAQTGTCQTSIATGCVVHCEGASLMGCESNQRLVQLDLCASSELCSKTLIDRANDPSTFNGKCTQGCTPGAYRCNPDNPTELQSCPPSALDWVTVSTCVTSALCDAMNGRCALPLG